MSCSVTATIILQQTVIYLEQILSQPELRHRILTSARVKLPSPLHPTLLQSLTLISQSLRNSSAAQKLLLSLPTATPLSSLLLSLTYTHRRRHVSAALVLLDLFVLDPAFARSELAPPIYENLFVPHLMPAIQWFSDQRSQILVSCNDDDEEEEEEGEDRSMAFEAMSVLSRMSGGQAEELRALEKGYEDVMDENCRVYAEYLKKVLEGSDDLNPPQLVVMKTNGELDSIEEEAAEIEHGMLGMDKEQYNNVKHSHSLVFFVY